MKCEKPVHLTGFVSLGRRAGNHSDFRAPGVLVRGPRLRVRTTASRPRPGQPCPCRAGRRRRSAMCWRRYGDGSRRSRGTPPARRIWRPCRSRASGATNPRPRPGRRPSDAHGRQPSFQARPASLRRPPAPNRERRHVHALRRHGDLIAIPLPLGGHAVGINLDAVALGIGEVERLADQMVRRAVDLDLTFGGEIYPAAEIGTRRQQECRMEKPGASGIIGLCGLIRLRSPATAGPWRPA